MLENLLQAVERNRNIILDTERYIWERPETGYKEYKTSAYLAKIFQELGYKLTFADNIPGFYTLIDTGRPGPTVLVLGEMDSVICPEHKEADSTTGAVHACGHNIQCAALVGTAAALRESPILDQLCGKIKLCAVPAEELIELEYRNQLKEKGVIHFLTGKCEFLHRGYFDDVDMAIMIHASTDCAVGVGAVGCVAKEIIYKGKAAHAGGNPWDGINALYAANCGLNAVNAIRETFQEKNIVRFHPIITNGGAMVNAVPERVTMEAFVRGASYDSIAIANKKINRALCGGALSLGANVDILDYPGYAPLVNDENLISVATEAAQIALPNKKFTVYDGFTSGSTDMGDLSCIMPVVHPFISGIQGKTHGSDYCVIDPETACIGGAKFLLAMIYLLLSKDAQRAKSAIRNAKKPLTKDEYFAFLETITSQGDRLEYFDNGVVKVNIQ